MRSSLDFERDEMVKNHHAFLRHDVSWLTMCTAIDQLGTTCDKVSDVHNMIRDILKDQARCLCDSVCAEIGACGVHTLLLSIPCCEKNAYLGAMPITWLMPFLQLGELDELFFNRGVSMYLVSLLRLCASSLLRFTHPHMQNLRLRAQAQLNHYSQKMVLLEGSFRGLLCRAQPEFRDSLSMFPIWELGMTVACDILAPRLRRLPGWCARLDADGELQLVWDGENHYEVEDWCVRLLADSAERLRELEDEGDDDDDDNNDDSSQVI